MYTPLPGASEASIGIVEKTNTATHSISNGEYLMWKGQFCVATSNISIGDTLSSSNVTAIPNGVGARLTELDSKQLSVIYNSTSARLTVAIP